MSEYGFHAAKKPGPFPLSALKREHPHLVGLYRQPGTPGQRPSLILEKLWRTTNGHYGQWFDPLPTRPITKAPMRSELWNLSAWDTSNGQYGRVKGGSMRSAKGPVKKEVPLWPKQWQDQDLPPTRPPTPLPSHTPPYTPGIIAEMVVKPLPDKKILPPIANHSHQRFIRDSPVLHTSLPDPQMSAPVGATAVSKDYILSGNGKAYLEHSLGRFWVNINSLDTKTVNLNTNY